MDEKIGLKQWHFWRKSGIVTDGVTAKATALKTKEMLRIEDISDIALPSTTQDHCYVAPSTRYMQLGTNAMQKVRHLLCQGQDFNGRVPVVMDFSPDVGNELFALMEEENSWMYFGLCEDPKHLEWLLLMAETHAVQLVKEGKMKIKGFTATSES